MIGLSKTNLGGKAIMGVQIPIQRIEVPAGQQILLRDVSWQEFEAILQELSDPAQPVLPIVMERLKSSHLYQNMSSLRKLLGMPLKTWQKRWNHLGRNASFAIWKPFAMLLLKFDEFRLQTNGCSLGAIDNRRYDFTLQYLSRLL